MNIHQEYKKWCKEIAKNRDAKEIILHFREHVWEHYDRYDRDEKISLKIWLVGVFNFFEILKEKYPDITTKDCLFKLCSYYKNHNDGPTPGFDIDKFLETYNGDINKLEKLKK